MIIDKKCGYILTKLENAGYKAYLVGGCVRDMLMGRKSSDLDITTNALPDQIISVFSGDKVVPTGLKHGTITVIREETSFEITTFRIDGNYSDSRHPDEVKFTSELRDDLARRDFTVNAIAMDINGNIYDYFNGKDDIKNRVIRCVGEPEERFGEDALRILRAIRFSSVLGFDIEKNTAEAALKLKNKLDNVSEERISAELLKLLCGDDVVRVLLEYREIIGQIIPELTSEFDFDQHSKYHKYNVYEHTARAVGGVQNESEYKRILRLTMLLHDISKPDVFYLDENGVGHFKGHAKAGAEKARNILKRMKFDNKTTDTVCELIAYHSDDIESDKQIKRLVGRMGLEKFLMLMEVKKADNMGKHSFVLSENELFDSFAETAKELASEESCMNVSGLKINGDDLILLGFNGKEIGECLEKLTELVIDDEIPNKREALIKYAEDMKK